MPKNMTFAVLEGIQSEMRREKLLTLFYEYQTPSAPFGDRAINLEAEFGRRRVRFCAIDEQWIVGGVALAAIQGLNQKLEEQNAALEKEVAELKALVKALAEKVNGGER